MGFGGSVKKVAKKTNKFRVAKSAANKLGRRKVKRETVRTFKKTL